LKAKKNVGFGVIVGEKKRIVQLKGKEGVGRGNLRFWIEIKGRGYRKTGESV